MRRNRMDKIDRSDISSSNDRSRSLWLERPQLKRKLELGPISLILSFESIRSSSHCTPIHSASGTFPNLTRYKMIHSFIHSSNLSLPPPSPTLFFSAHIIDGLVFLHLINSFIIFLISGTHFGLIQASGRCLLSPKSLV